MPYKLRKVKSKYCVFNTDTGENKGCSTSRSQGLGHMRALYAASSGEKMGKKELDELLLKSVDEGVFISEEELREAVTLNKDYVPLGVTSFADLDRYRQAEELQMEVYEDTSDLIGLIQSAMYDPNVTDKAAAVVSLSNEFASRVQQESSDVGDMADSTKDASEEDEDEHGDLEKAVWDTAYVNDLPDSAFLYVESGEKDSGGKTTPRSKRHFPYKDSGGKVDQAHVRNAIARIPQSNAPGLSTDKKKSLQNRARKMLSSANKETFVTQVKEAISTIFPGLSEIFQKKEHESDLMIWKEETGEYRWVGRYSNKFRDVDNPSQIIASKSHQRFVSMVEKGLAPYPDLMIWHMPEYKIGTADWLAWDDAGIALASGTITKGLENIAEWLMAQKDVSMSHGMPVKTIKYDPDDESVIVEHETRELSVLPYSAAANKLTGFILLNKEADMAISPKKKEELIKKWGATPETLDQLEALNKQTAQAAVDAGMESKEAEAPPVVETKDEAQNTQTEDAPTEEPITRQEIADGIAQVMGALSAQISELSQKFDAVSAEVKALKESDESKIAEKASKTPAASIGALLAQRAIGNPDARVDGRSSLAQSKPKETEAAPESSTGISFLDKIIASNHK